MSIRDHRNPNYDFNTLEGRFVTVTNFFRKNMLEMFYRIFRIKIHHFYRKYPYMHPMMYYVYKLRINSFTKKFCRISDPIEFSVSCL